MPAKKDKQECKCLKDFNCLCSKQYGCIHCTQEPKSACCGTNAHCDQCGKHSDKFYYDISESTAMCAECSGNSSTSAPVISKIETPQESELLNELESFNETLKTTPHLERFIYSLGSIERLLKAKDQECQKKIEEERRRCARIIKQHELDCEMVHTQVCMAEILNAINLNK